MPRAIALVTALILVSGCGGGAAGSVGNAVMAPVMPTTTPTPAATTQPQPTPQSKPNVAIAMQIGQSAETAARTIAAHRAAIAAQGVRTPQYVSTSTLGVKVVVYPHGSSTALMTLAYDVSSGSNICTGSGPRTCTLALYLQPGSYDFSMTLYDAPPVSGAIPGSAHALSTGSLTNQTIQPYAVNSLAFVVDGIVSSLSAPTFASVPADGSAHTVAVSFVAYDADGKIITGSQPYASPINVSLAESGGSGLAHLTVNGSSVGTSATITTPGQTLAIVYNGGGSAGYTTLTSISSASAPAQQVRVSPLYVSTTTVDATDASQSNTITLSEAYAPATSYTTSGWTCGGFSSGASNGGSGSGTVTITSPAAVTGSPLQSSYSCGAMTIRDAYGTARTISTIGASIPVSPTCASSSSATYLGVKSGSNYVTASGSPCALTLGTGSLSMYYAPNDGSHPGSASTTVSEANDRNGVTPNTSSCGSVASLSPSVTPGGYASAMSGTLNAAAVQVTSAPAGTQSCTATIADNNGQTRPLSLAATPSIMTTSGTAPVDNESESCMQFDQQGDVDCAGAWTYTLNGGTSSYFFSNASNAVALNVTYAASGTVQVIGTGVCLWDQTHNKTYALPYTTNGSGDLVVQGTFILSGGAGSYEVYGFLSSDTTASHSPGGYSGQLYGSAVTAPSNASGATTLTATGGPTYYWNGIQGFQEQTAC